MRRMLIVILALVCILSACSKKNSSPGSNSGSSSSSDSSVTNSDSNDSISTQNDLDEDWEEYYDDWIDKVSGDISGTMSVSNKKIGTDEIRPDRNSTYKLNPMIGGADAEAKIMQENILNAVDNLKITGTKYYISPNGNDTNDGLSPKTAFQTLHKTAEIQMKAGDAVLLERGAIFRLPGSFSCRSGITYGAYGTGEKPIICGSPVNFAKGSMWNPSNIKNIWRINFPFNGDVGIIVFNHGEMAGNKLEYVRHLAKNGDYYFNGVDSTLYLYCDKGNPGILFKSIEIGSRVILFNLPSYSANNITIDNICFKYTGNFAIRGSVNSKNITVTNCEIGWIGGSLQPDGLAVYGNGIEFIGGCQDILVENNWIYQTFDSAVTFQSTNADGTIYDNISFKNNLMEYCGMSGIEWWCKQSGDQDDTIVKNISFDKNIIRFTGYGWVKDGVRGARHIQGPWGMRDFTQMSNFTITNNIFDCALGGVYWWKFESLNPAYFMVGNTYYQRPTPLNIVNNFGTDGTSYATNQSEFETAIKKMEVNPKLIKWLDQ